MFAYCIAVHGRIAAQQLFAQYKSGSTFHAIIPVLILVRMYTMDVTHVGLEKNGTRTRCFFMKNLLHHKVVQTGIKWAKYLPGIVRIFILKNATVFQSPGYLLQD